MRKRTCHIYSLVLLCLLPVIGWCWSTPAFCRESRPNIVLIFVDDLGYGDLSCFGLQSSPFSTPHIDKMADEGARLTNCYVTVPYCAPSRASLLTGRYPFRNGLTTNPAPDAGIHHAGLPGSEITLAEALKTVGYSTTCIGKWHLGHTEKFLPRRQGFDEYYGILYSNDMRPVQIVENEQVVEYPVIQAHLTRKYTDRALDFIERNYRRNQPFFLYLPYAMPHKPLAASEDFYTPDTPGDLYADVIRELDYSMGRILERIEELELDDNTLILFLSDNGPWYGGSTGGLRGMKSRTWDGGIHVPMIARWPGTIPEGLVNHALASSMDIFPTVLNLAGVSQPDDRLIDGRDIWPLLTSATAESPHEAVFAMHGVRLMTVRSGQWKLHVHPPQAYRQPSGVWLDPRGPDGVTIIAPAEQSQPVAYPGIIGGDEPSAMMLFDLEADPAEQHNVAAAHPDVVRRLKALYDDMAAQMPEIKPSNRERQHMRRLRGGALRYDRY
jgi:arylsulfatase A-like enzyme